MQMMNTHENTFIICVSVEYCFFLTFSITKTLYSERNFLVLKNSS